LSAIVSSTVVSNFTSITNRRVDIQQRYFFVNIVKAVRVTNLIAIAMEVKAETEAT